MSKELPYWRFTSSEWLNGDIGLEDYEVKGVFIDLCAYYWFRDCSITQAMLYKRFNNAETSIIKLLEAGIIKKNQNDDFITIEFLNEQFDELSELRKHRQDAGSKGGKQRSSNAKAKLKQKSSYNDKDKDKDKERYLIPPTIEMVQKYCEKIGSKIDPQYFLDSNNMRGWIYGKNKTKIIDWQACVRTWEKNRKKSEPRQMMP